MNVVATYILCIRNGNAVTCKSDLPSLYKHKSIGFEEFEDTTQHDAKYEDKGEHQKRAFEDRRWYSAGKGLDVFQEIRVRIAAGERLSFHARQSSRSAKN